MLFENPTFTTGIIIVTCILILILGSFFLDMRQEMVERQSDIKATVSWGVRISYPKIKVRKVRFFKRWETEVTLDEGDILTIGKSTSTATKSRNGKEILVPIPSGNVTIEEIVYDAYHEMIGELRKTVTLSPGDKVHILRENICIMTGAGNETIRRIVYARAEGKSTFKTAPDY